MATELIPWKHGASKMSCRMMRWRSVKKKKKICIQYDNVEIEKKMIVGTECTKVLLKNRQKSLLGQDCRQEGWPCWIREKLISKKHWPTAGGGAPAPPWNSCSTPLTLEYLIAVANLLSDKTAYFKEKHRRGIKTESTEMLCFFWNAKTDIYLHLQDASSSKEVFYSRGRH